LNHLRLCPQESKLARLFEFVRERDFWDAATREGSRIIVVMIRRGSQDLAGEPLEMCAAIRAEHVIASLNFKNGRAAARTIARVALNCLYGSEYLGLALVTGRQNFAALFADLALACATRTI
jgi:hypothetical protein